MDSNVGSLLIIDVDFVIVLMKSITISKDVEFSISFECPGCSKNKSIRLSLNSLDYKYLDAELLNDIEIVLNNVKVNLRLRTVDEFLTIAANYLRSKTITDVNLIKLISLIKEYDLRPNDAEALITNASHEDISTLVVLKDLYFQKLTPIRFECSSCSSDNSKHLISLENLKIDPFRSIIENNPLATNKKLLEQIRKE
jgi:hypothetical protein